LLRRDDVIRTLSANLRTMTENRDSLQTEYMTQAGQLVEQVQVLQGQLKQVSLQDYNMDIFLTISCSFSVASCALSSSDMTVTFCN